MSERDTLAMYDWITAEVDTLSIWLPMLEKAIAAAPKVTAVQELRGIVSAIESIRPQGRRIARRWKS